MRGQIGNPGIRSASGSTIDDQQPRRAAFGRRLLRDQVLGKVEVEVGEAHGWTPMLLRAVVPAHAPLRSISAAARSGSMISWWPVSEKPRPSPFVGRFTTFVCGR